ncbi:MAG: hypothetical protein K8T20_13080 [Planctomycetes bacterium]|nr:hypothetical protein [Planctomycetota bacterium]
MKFTGAIGLIFGLSLNALVWAQETPATSEPAPAGTPAGDAGSAPPAATDPVPAAGEPKKEEPAKEAEPKKEEPVKEAPVEGAKEGAAPAEESAGDKGPLDDILGFPVHGRLALKFRGRWESSKDSKEHDTDLYQEVSADIGNVKKHMITAHFSLRVSEDLDGENDNKKAHVFDSLQDTYGHAWHGDLYYAHVDLHRLLFLDLVRVGRQSLDETPMVLYMDGLRADTMAWKQFFSLQGGVYAGAPVHYFESAWRGDSIIGAFIQARPWTGARVRAEYTRIRDATTGGTQRDNLWNFSAWQQIADVLTLNGRFSILNTMSRDHLLRADLYVTDWDFRVDASWYRLYRTQNLTTIDTDFFTSALHSYFPYDQFRLLVAKGIGKHINLQAGGDLRAVSPYDDEGPGNRSFVRFFFSPGITNWPIDGLSASVTLEYWNIRHTRNGDTQSAGFDVSYKGIKGLKISAGSNFALWKYDVFDDLERQHVQTYYARVSYSPWKPLKFEVGYELEDTKSDDFHKVKVSVSYTF